MASAAHRLRITDIVSRIFGLDRNGSRYDLVACFCEDSKKSLQLRTSCLRILGTIAFVCLLIAWSVHGSVGLSVSQCGSVSAARVLTTQGANVLGGGHEMRDAPEQIRCVVLVATEWGIRRVEYWL
jgi:hypothetical protein